MTASTADSGLDGFSALPSAASSLFDSGSGNPFSTVTGDKSTGVGAHYWQVRLDCPPGASAALRSFVGLAQTAIQTAVDLLGRGTPITPPDVSDLMRPVVYQDLGQSESTVGYHHALSQIQQRQTALLTLDNEVTQTSVVVAASQDQTLAAIEQLVGDLNDTLDSVGSAKLKAAQEQSLMWQIANVVEEIYKAVDSVSQQNQQIAGTAAGSGSSSGASTSNSGSGGGDMSGLMQLAMIPMTLASSLAPTIMQIVQKQMNSHHDGSADPNNGGSNNGDPNKPGQTVAAGPAAAPNSAAATPGTANVAAPASANGAAPASANGATPAPGTATPAANRRQRRTRVSVNGPGNGDAPNQPGNNEETADDTTAETATGT